MQLEQNTGPSLHATAPAPAPQEAPEQARVLAALARKATAEGLPSACAFLCYWAAFEALCTWAAAQAGLHPRFALRRNGTMQTRRVGEIKVSQAQAPSQEAQIEALLARLDAQTRHTLVMHPAVRFFVFRKPTWQSQPLSQDVFKQHLNGVIDVALTVDARYPVWSPVDPKAYARYTAKGGDSRIRNALAQQILGLLCTVRSNLTYGGPRMDRESADDVVEHALALLSMLVEESLRQA